MFKKLFKDEVKLSLGCTEPCSVALAVSLAYNAILGKVPERLKAEIDFSGVQEKDIEINGIEVKVDRGTFKNGLFVGVPRSGKQKGLLIAAAMGVYCSSQEGNEMMLFSTFQKDDLEKAKKLRDKVKVDLVNRWWEGKKIDIEASVKVKHKQTPGRMIEGVAKIEKSHNNVTFIKVRDTMSNGVTQFSYEPKQEEKSYKEELKKMNINKIVEMVERDWKDVEKNMVCMIRQNIDISKKGLEKARGLGIGVALNKLMNEQILANDMVTFAQKLVSAATDARMTGCDCAAMSSAGSGNQGIMASLPIIAVTAKNNNYDIHNVEKWLEEQETEKVLFCDKQIKFSELIKALVLSNIITCYVTYHTDYLTALCGCAIKAGIGATAGIAYLLSDSGCKIKNVESAIQNMAGDITGMICDGAKEGCSLKLATSASVAVRSALLAIRGIKISSDNGIIAESVEDTIKNIGRICEKMTKTDVEIVNTMIDKHRNLLKSWGMMYNCPQQERRSKNGCNQNKEGFSITSAGKKCEAAHIF